jgi:hypothetical protein
MLNAQLYIRYAQPTLFLNCGAAAYQTYCNILPSVRQSQSFRVSLKV